MLKFFLILKSKFFFLYIYSMYYFLQFKCDPKFVNKIKTSLESHQYQYHVISAEESYIPKTIIELDDSDMEAVSNIHKAVSSIEDISDIYDNLA